MTEAKIQDFADKFTNEVLTSKYRERFTSLDDVEDDDEINRIWEYLNEKFYNTILNIIYV